MVDSNFKPWLGTKAFLSLMVISLGGLFYTAVTYEFDWKLKSVALVGTTIQGIVKYLAMIFWVENIHQNIMEIKQIYDANSTKVTRRSQILVKWGQRFVWLLNGFYCMIMLTAMLFAIYPLLVYLVVGRREYILPLFMPLLDENTSLGYKILTLMHMVWTCMAAIGLAGSDSVLAMQVFHVLPMVDLFEHGFVEINRALKPRPNRLEKSSAVKKWVRNLVRMHQEMSNYMDSIGTIYSVCIFCDVYTNGFSMCFIIFCLMVQKWLPLYFLLLVTFVKLFVICFLGTVIETASDSILSIIQSSNWQLLPLNLQRHIMLMLAKAQNPCILMAGTVPLNLDTFVNIMKSVYSTAMLLSEVIE